MARVNLYNLTPREQKELLKKFFVAITNLENLQEVENFFKDLLHPQEIVMLARRLKAAEMLIKGESFREIAKKMKISLATLAKIHRWVNSERKGYKIAIKRLKLNQVKTRRRLLQ